MALNSSIVMKPTFSKWYLGTDNTDMPGLNKSNRSKSSCFNSRSIPNVQTIPGSSLLRLNSVGEIDSISETAPRGQKGKLGLSKSLDSFYSLKNYSNSSNSMLDSNLNIMHSASVPSQYNVAPAPGGYYSSGMQSSQKNLFNNQNMLQLHSSNFMAGTIPPLCPSDQANNLNMSHQRHPLVASAPLPPLSFQKPGLVNLMPNANSIQIPDYLQNGPFFSTLATIASNKNQISSCTPTHHHTSSGFNSNLNKKPPASASNSDSLSAANCSKFGSTNENSMTSKYIEKDMQLDSSVCVYENAINEDSESTSNYSGINMNDKKVSESDNTAIVKKNEKMVGKSVKKQTHLKRKNTTEMEEGEGDCHPSNYSGSNLNCAVSNIISDFSNVLFLRKTPKKGRPSCRKRKRRQSHMVNSKPSSNNLDTNNKSTSVSNQSHSPSPKSLVPSVKSKKMPSPSPPIHNSCVDNLFCKPLLDFESDVSDYEDSDVCDYPKSLSSPPIGLGPALSFDSLFKPMTQSKCELKEAGSPKPATNGFSNFSSSPKNCFLMGFIVSDNDDDDDHSEWENSFESFSSSPSSSSDHLIFDFEFGPGLSLEAIIGKNTDISSKATDKKSKKNCLLAQINAKWNRCYPPLPSSPLNVAVSNIM